MASRTTPFKLVFGTLASERFPEIRASLEAAKLDPHDLDAFILDREVVRLLREMVPDEGVGAAVREHAALLHHAYLYWLEGGWLFRLSREAAVRLLTQSSSLPPPPSAGAPRAYYIQFPERLVWAEITPGEPHEPLDGLFVRPWPTGGYFILAIFGLHPGREGFSVVDVDGHVPEALERRDGSALYAPVLPGGAAAGLFSIIGEDELLALGERTVPLVTAAAARADHTEPHQVIEVA
ncbi:MAG: hypothetical protein ABJD11_16630 [Gemmatimonadota bacterium]